MTERHDELYESHAEIVTAEEQQLLKEHEPFVDFRVVSAAEAGLSTGRQSRVSVLEYDHNGEAYQVLWKRMAAGKGLTNTEAQAFDSRLEPYRASLIESGWNVPELYYHRVSSINAESQIFSYEQFIAGGDGEKMLEDSAQPNFRKWFMVEEITRTLARYAPEDLVRTELAGKTVTQLPHGLDLKLANVVLAENDNRLYFVDLFGPKELDEKGSWRSFSPKLDSLDQEALKAVCASREGAILRCWRLAEAHWNNGYEDIGELRGDFLRHLSRTGLADEEVDFIKQEIEANYPWLNTLYREHRI